MNLETLKARALSGTTAGMTTAACEVERAQLAAIVAEHRARRDAAVATFDEVRDAFLPVRCGRYTVTERDYWRYPAVAVAHEALVAVEDEDLASWAQARLGDLDARLGRGFSPQLRLALVA